MVATLDPSAPAFGIGMHRTTFAQYRNIQAINWHSLDPYRQSPMHARHEQLLPADASDSQVFGEAYHCAILEPERFDADYCVMPTFEGHHSSNIHKAAKRDWIAANASKVHLTQSEMETIYGMQRAVREHKTASALFSGKGKNERSAVWKDPETGRLCKGRVDRICRIPAVVLNPAASASDEVLCLIDVKTSRSPGPNPNEFARQVADYAYHAQAAWYYDGLRILEPADFAVLIVAIGTTFPIDVVVHQLDHEVIDEGRKLYRRLLRTCLQCEKTKRWPGSVPEGVNFITLPKWAKEAEGL